MRSKTRWGIIGTGNIANLFAEGLRAVNDAEIVAVGSRSQAAADSFGERYGIQRRHADYAELAADAEVDVVYIATPNSLHHDNTLLCLAAGKPVLCEKPFAINAIQADEMVRSAREKGLFLMEAMWTRFFPLVHRLREVLQQGVIGTPRLLTADFGFREELDPESILFQPAFGGGSLLDVGVYPVSLASMLFGSPAEITSSAHVGVTGVDEQAAVILKFAGGELAVLHSAIVVETPQEAVLCGTGGSIRIRSPWWRPSEMIVVRGEGEPETLRIPYEGNGYGHEAAEVMRCLRSGKLESDLMPLDETVRVMQTLDQLRAQWGLRYPMEL